MKSVESGGSEQIRLVLCLGMMVVALSVSLPHFSTTPDGILTDTWEYVPQWLTRRHQCTPSIPPFLYDIPAAAGYWVMGTLMSERIMGLGFALVVVVLLSYTSLIPLVSVPIVAAVLTATRLGLWSQRHHLGIELVALQIVLILMLRRASWWATVVAGMLLGLAPFIYAACFVWLTYPLLFVRRLLRLLFLYAMGALLVVPAMLYCHVTPLGLRSLAGDQWAVSMLPARAALLIRAFWDVRASIAASWAWSYPGAQHMPWLVLACAVAGTVVALGSRDGWRWIALFVIGMIAPLAGNARLAASHREIMMLLPLAVLCGWWVRLIPMRAQIPVSAVGALCIAYLGYQEWSDPAFWAAWPWRGQW